MGDWESEERVLTSGEGRELLAAVGRVKAPGPADLGRWRRSASADLVAAAVRLAEARRRGAAKFSRADRMWLDAKGLEQSTAEPVARSKARRFEGLVVDLCSGIGGDTLALAERASVLSVDADPGMCRRTAWNAEVYAVGPRVQVVTARAERMGIPEGALVHVDPDRRAGAKGRARSVADYAPGVETLHALVATGRGGAIKLGPASDFEAQFGALAVEVELTSLGGECKEATIWFGDRASCRRRATVLPAGASWTDRDGPASRSLPTVPVAGWVFDPDPALLRAGLLEGFALAHGLGRVAPGVDFLTGPEPVASPFLAPFEVIEVHPLDLKRLRRVVADRRLGPLEIKTRGVDHRPEEVRKVLKPRGDTPATFLLAGGGAPARAILARRRGGAEPTGWPAEP